MEVLKVSAKTDVSKLAGAIAAIIRKSEKLELHTIGAGALNQAVKAIAVARGFVAPTGIEIVTVPAFEDLKFNGKTMTAIKMEVKAI